MVQEKQLKELFKYIEANCDVCLDDVDKRDIKRIFGGVLCDDIMNDTLHEVKVEPEEPKDNCSTFDMSRLVDQEYKPTDQVTEQVTDHEQPQEKPALNPIAEAYHNYKPIRYIDWDTSVWIKKHCDGYSIDERGEVYKNDSIQFNFDESPQHWELYTEPAEQSSSQVKLDNSFDKERFEAMFRAVYQTTKSSDFNLCVKFTEEILTELDAYYADKGGNNG